MANNNQNDASDSEPHERTTMQQEKAILKKKQDKREAGLQSARSRSSSRRARRQRIQKGMEDGKYMKTTSLEALEEADANNELNQMGMFERIGPDSTSMDGPVTHARAMRGEIPMRGTDPNQPYRMEPEKKKGSLEDQDGLKLTLEANLEIEIELKASIRGDLTLSLYGDMLPEISLPSLPKLPKLPQLPKVSNIAKLVPNTPKLSNVLYSFPNSGLNSE
ncbi:uncharacterized protein EKO05_0006535 [Ascochyta rabiei]|uniref:Uncharacterized protein n=1 Tax=Didymella rabiei TaxID=5454 RepID=A0A162VZ89_DIDRA|nr:uncharacterized protein EKO05_0006535 [Ascochyta rabiei]KZM18686.1 hypothetical protein ST47_g10104 [Ascochyta rabiei]UPX16113.1 hypothetical protein EKO05_0006535 [Ascochyta rabiei]